MGLRTFSELQNNFRKYPNKESESEDYIDLGASVLDFYSSLVDLLAKCAPDPLTIQAGKGDSVRARAILRSLISLEDLGNILALRFTIPNLALASTTSDGNVTIHYLAGGVRKVQPFHTLNQFIDTTNSFATIASNIASKLHAEKLNKSKIGRLKRQFSMEASPSLYQLKHKYTSFDHILRIDEEETDSDVSSSNLSVYQTPDTTPLMSRRQPEYNAEIFSIQKHKKGVKRRSSTCKLRCRAVSCCGFISLTGYLYNKINHIPFCPCFDRIYVVFLI